MNDRMQNRKKGYLNPGAVKAINVARKAQGLRPATGRLRVGSTATNLVY